MILFLTKDLMIQSNASAAANSAGLEIRAVASQKQLLEKLESDATTAVFVDLQTPGLDVNDLLQSLDQKPLKIPTYAFAQHVNDALLELARGNTFEAVLTRGQFFTRLPSLIKHLAEFEPQ